MPDDQWVPLTFEKGLNTFDQPSVLDDGECQALENFDWLPNGGIVPRPGWLAAGNSPTGAPTEMRGRGIFTDWYESGVRKLVVGAWDNTTNFTVHKTNVSDPTTFSSYTSVETIAISAGYYTDQIDFASGLGVLMYTHPGFPSGQLRTYDGSTAAALSTDGDDASSLSNIAGRAIVYHLNRFWVGGSPTYPTHLKFSEVGDYDAWDLENNYLPIGQDDGEPIESIVVWEQGLVIGKQHSLWYMSGYTSDSFRVTPISLGIGCARGPRSLQATPDGVYVVGIDGNVYLYRGADLERLTTRTFVTTMPSTGYMTSALVGGKLFVAATGTGQTVYVWERGRWRKETLSDSSHYVQDLASYDDRYLLASAVDGTRLLSVRQEVGPYATSTYRTPAHDVSASQTYEATTKEFWPKGPLGKGTLRSVYVRFRQWTAGSGEPLTITPVVDGTAITAQAKTLGNETSAGTYSGRVTFHTESATMTGTNFAVKFSSSPTSGEAQTYSVEEALAQVVVDRGRR